MVVDPSRLRRRGLGSPPTDGNPTLEEETTLDQGAAAGGREEPDEGQKDAAPQAAAATARMQRAPRAEIEPRVPFTTRIAVSTKERLEAACFLRRMKHQDFIDEALRIHLKKNGF